MNKALTAALALTTSAALAQTATPTPATAPSPVAQQSVGLEAALRIAQGAVANCAQQGYAVAATVVDRAGVTVAVARADNAGPHTVDASRRKAYTSASARNTTAAIAENIRANPASAELASVEGFLVLAGGAPIRVNNVVIGAVGVGGAPSGAADEKCATDAIAAVFPAR